MRKLLSVLRTSLSILLAVALLTVPLTVKADTTIYNVTNAEELESALSNAASGDIIRLKAHINYSKGIVVTNKTITFDLSIYKLHVENKSGTALEVGEGGLVNINDENGGYLSLIGHGVNKYGVYAHNGGKATVTDTCAFGQGGIGAYAEGEGSLVIVTDNSVAIAVNSYGAYAKNGGIVSIGEDATAFADYSTAVAAYGDGSLIEVSGEVMGYNGAAAYAGGTVKIHSNINVDDTGVHVSGPSSTVFVSGDIIRNWTDIAATGIWAVDGGTATIDGAIYTEKYIRLGNDDKTADEFSGWPP